MSGNECVPVKWHFKCRCVPQLKEIDSGNSRQSPRQHPRPDVRETAIAPNQIATRPSKDPRAQENNLGTKSDYD